MKNKDDALDIVQETAYQSYLKFNTLNDLKLFNFNKHLKHGLVSKTTKIRAKYPVGQHD
ncbi:hypothetical protein [Bacillus sp. sid0103]|uniref:hypothetical protein n=1 Tax=Bacillus sp. sid0103 TaxID=2856337 RepID=UPI0035B4C055